jgi:hypothetical protein
MIMNIANSIDWGIGSMIHAAFRQELERTCKAQLDGEDISDDDYADPYEWDDLTFDIDAVIDSLYFNLEDAAENYGYTTRNIL